MPEYRGYHNRSLEFLKENHVSVGDTVEISSNGAVTTYTGIIMPRYEQQQQQQQQQQQNNGDTHIVLKLDSGYNIGLDITQIEKITTKKVDLVVPAETIPNSKESATVSLVATLQTKKLPRILLLSTGGTIVSKIDYRTGAVTPVLSASDLLKSVPELASMASFDAEVVFSEYSENLVPEHWLQLAQKIKNHILDNNYAGFIIAHGTDTMHYTSAFLSFALAGIPVPVALVGSQRSSDRASSDAASNLIGAVRFITECKANGVYIIMHKDTNDDAIACHQGTRVRKNHTSKRSAFQTIGSQPAFVVPLHPTTTPIQKNLCTPFYPTINKFEPRISIETKVALVKYHPGYDPALLDHIINTGYKGVIFEGTGLGHVGKTTYDIVKKAVGTKLFVGMTSQCIDGRVGMTVYESGRDLLDMGVIPLSNMIPEVALVKAMWIMSYTTNPSDVARLMLTNIASEMYG